MTPSFTPTHLVSGGQTGVDRAALDAAIVLGIRHGGWCPKGRRAEDGPIPEPYQLQETESRDYRVRTRRNVEESDATLILTRGEPAGGTALTVQCCQRLERPFQVVRLETGEDVAAAEVRQWLASQRPNVLNVAGPRESGAPGIGAEAERLLRSALSD